jgi:tetratricopeptide (TPR) repeat protein
VLKSLLSRNNVSATKRMRGSATALIVLFSLSLGGMGAALALALGSRSFLIILPTLGAALPAALIRWRFVADQATRIASLPLEETDLSAHGPLRQLIISIALFGVATTLIFLSLSSMPGGGWWLGAAFLPLSAGVAYIGRQWCRPGTWGRAFFAGTAGCCMGIFGNLAASETDRMRCEAQSNAALGDAFRPLVAKLDQILLGQRELVVEVSGLRQDVAKLQNGMGRAPVSPDGPDTFNPSSVETDLIRVIFEKGDALDRAVALVAQEAAKASQRSWDEVDSQIALVEIGRTRGYFADPADQHIYYVLRGDRHRFADEPDKAIPWYRQALQMQPTNLATNILLAHTLSHAGLGEASRQWAEARSILEAVIVRTDVQERERAVVLNDLALIQLEQRDLSAARKSIDQAIEIDLKQLPDPPSLATRYANLSLIQKAQGHLEEAGANLERAIEIQKTHSGEDHPIFAIRYNNLAMIRQDQSDLPAAQSNMERAIEIRKRHFGADDVELASFYNNLSRIQNLQDDLVGARDSIERAIEIATASLGPDHPRVAVFCSTLGLIQKAQKDVPGARTSMERAIEIDRKHFAQDSLIFATRYANLALIQQAQGELPAARDNMQRSIEIQLKRAPDDHLSLANFYNNMGRILEAEGNLAEARVQMETAIDLDTKHLTQNHVNLGFHCHNFVSILWKMGEREAAIAMQERASSIFAMRLPPNHQTRRKSEQRIADMKAELQRSSPQG